MRSWCCASPMAFDYKVKHFRNIFSCFKFRVIAPQEPQYVFSLDPQLSASQTFILLISCNNFWRVLSECKSFTLRNSRGVDFQFSTIVFSFSFRVSGIKLHQKYNDLRTWYLVFSYWKRKEHYCVHSKDNRVCFSAPRSQFFSLQERNLPDGAGFFRQEKVPGSSLSLTLIGSTQQSP